MNYNFLHWFVELLSVRKLLTQTTYETSDSYILKC